MGTTKSNFLMPILPKEKLTKRIIVALTESDFKELSKACKENKVTKSDLIRYFVQKILRENNNEK
jgi:metal-responsive CopG/Arc/MetJ family transcriptional regulator